ncbi:MAG TPA: hypothetical protein ENN80_14605 [Candidatus Hydrogenedentes bacterium]|nr:hypothetical protein [Candidatus Hydrogenedentota bacterium]
MPDHIHMCLSVPPKLSIARTIGFPKDKSTVRIHCQLLHERRMTGLSFWATPLLCQYGRIARRDDPAIYPRKRRTGIWTGRTRSHVTQTTP